MVLGALGALLSAPVWVWALGPENPARVVVLDATVPHADYREHESLFWILNHRRTTPSSGRRPWKVDRDYIGWYPERKDAEGLPERRRLTAADLDGADLLWIADDYGVYTGDFEAEGAPRAALDYSQRLWGGLDATESLAIERFTLDGGNLVAEFNTFASPTAGEARARLEALLGVRWTGWSGRFFQDLSDTSEVPAWAARHWRSHHGTDWSFHGPGWMFSQEDTRILVLQPGRHMGPRGLRITDKLGGDPLTARVADDVPFAFWFDVIQADEGTEILAWYRPDLTEEGRAILATEGLPDRFPAITRASRRPLRLYLAGDFSDNRLDRGPYAVAGMANFRALTGARARDQRGFFWSLQVPLVSAILEEVDPSRPSAGASP
jgi:hypothetical protein